MHCCFNFHIIWRTVKCLPTVEGFCVLHNSGLSGSTTLGRYLVWIMAQTLKLELSWNSNKVPVDEKYTLSCLIFVGGYGSVSRAGHPPIGRSVVWFPAPPNGCIRRMNVLVSISDGLVGTLPCVCELMNVDMWCASAMSGWKTRKALCRSIYHFSSWFMKESQHPNAQMILAKNKNRKPAKQLPNLGETWDNSRQHYPWFGHAFQKTQLAVFTSGKPVRGHFIVTALMTLAGSLERWNLGMSILTAWWKEMAGDSNLCISGEKVLLKFSAGQQ